MTYSWLKWARTKEHEPPILGMKKRIITTDPTDSKVIYCEQLQHPRGSGHISWKIQLTKLIKEEIKNPNGSVSILKIHY